MSRVRGARSLAVVAAASGAICVTAATAAGAAGTPAIAVAPKCVVNARPTQGSIMATAGSGFTPGDSIELSAGDASTSATVGTDGTFTTPMHAPTLASSGAGAKKFTLAARDETSGTGSASTTFWVANLAFSTKPAVAKPSKSVRFSFSGFKPGAVIYGHYLRGRKVVVTHRFGRATGVCGLLDAKAQLFPLRNPPAGRYKVQIDDSHRYRANSLPRVNSSIRIERF